MSWRTFVIILLSLSLVMAAAAVAQEKSPPGPASFKMKAIKLPSQFEYILNIQEFIPLAKKNGIAFAVTSIYNGPKNIHSFRITQNGKMTLLDTVAEDLETPGILAAVWIDGGAAAGADPAAGGHGLLFYGYDTDDDLSAKVSMVKFDASGKFTEGPTNIIDFSSSDSTDEVYINKVSAAAGPNSIAVAVSMETYNDTADKSTIYGRFFETDFDGNIIGGIREIPFDSNLNQYTYMYKPKWSGVRWMVPARVVIYDTSVRSTCQLISADSMVASAPVSATDISIQEIYDTGSSNTRIFDTKFLPVYQAASAAANPAITKRFDLFIHTVSKIPDHTSALTVSNNAGMIQQVKYVGNKVGKTKKTGIKPWSRATTAQKDMVLTEYYELYSDFIAFDSGSCLVARADMIERKSEVSSPPANWLNEGHIGILHLSKKYKKVEEIAGADFAGEQYPDYWPVFTEGFGKYWAIVQTRDPNASKDYFYIITLTQ